MEIDSINTTLSFTPDKVQKVNKTSQNFLRSHSKTILELTRIKDLLSLTIQAVDPAKIHIRLLYQQQIVCLEQNIYIYLSVITLNTKSKTELTWWIENLRFYNGRTFSQLNLQTIIQTDGSLTRVKQSVWEFKYQGNGQRKREPST